jgi:hypothetical protein
MGESMANQSSAVVDNATKSMGASMANNASAVGGNISLVDSKSYSKCYIE